jgi:hypothetical protein
MDAQKRLFEIVKNNIPEQYRLVEVVRELLDLSPDSAYRRIRGEKELSLSELQKLCKKFNLSMDAILNYNSTQSILFQYTSVNMADPESYIRYIERLSHSLIGLLTVEDKELFFTAQDIPFYHFLNHTELLFFKLYVWYDTLNKKHLSFKDFCEKLDKDRILPVYRQMFQAYMQIPSREIWTNQTVDTTLRLLDFYIETGIFNTKETVFLLLSQLSQLLDTVHEYVKDGYKDGEKRKIFFNLYVCSVDFENNFMLTRRENHLACTVKLYTVNSMTTDNMAFCHETRKWINDLILKSTLISGTSVKEQFRFFQTSKNKIDALVNKIESMK